MKYFNNFDPVGKLTQRVIFFNFIFFGYIKPLVNFQR